MAKQKILTALLLTLSILSAAGCLGNSSKKPAWAGEVNWQGDPPPEKEKLEQTLWSQITPYKTSYNHVNITSKKQGDTFKLRVVGNAAEGVDIYEFNYHPDRGLIRTGYLLEAIPPRERENAIATALGNTNIIQARPTGTPTVHRILPDTAEKYYTPKTLLSVTWPGTSALIDPEEMQVVKTWKSETTQ